MTFCRGMDLVLVLGVQGLGFRGFGVRACRGWRLRFRD